MTHISEEEMVEAYYAGVSDECRGHLEICLECSALYSGICETLESANESRVPERGVDYGQQVWARVSAELPAKREPWKRWMFAPPLAAGLALVLIGGIWSAHNMRSQAELDVPHAQMPIVVKQVKTSPVPPPRVVKRVAVPRKAMPSDSEQDAKLLALNSDLESNTKAALPQVLDIIQGASSDKTKEHALFVLAQSESVEARQALMNFAEQSSNTALQTKAVRMMGVMGDEGAGKELVGLYKTSSNQALKREILNGLWFSGSKNVSSLPLTVRIVGVPKTQKQQILNSVFMATDSQILENILQQEPNADLRVATVRSLAVMGERSQVLANIYRVDTDEKVQRAVLDALVVQQNSDALWELARAEMDSQRKAEILRRLAMIQRQEGILVLDKTKP